MSVRLLCTKETDTKFRVNSCLFDLDIPTPNGYTGFEVENVVEPELSAGKTAIHYYNPVTDEQSYEYVDRPLTQEEEIAQLKQDKVDLQSQMNTLMDTVNVLLGL